MARLRLAPVEYKQCSVCGRPYEGAQCPECRHPFDPKTTLKEIKDRLIMVGIDPAVYEPEQRCRCPLCGNLYVVTDTDLVTNAICEQCRQSLFEETQLQRIWKGAETPLQKARRLHQARARLTACPCCEKPPAAVCWCPRTSPPHDTSHPYGCLPQRTTVVWVRTFNVAESLHELQSREWLDKGEDRD